jgi:hypothetical protein
MQITPSAVSENRNKLWYYMKYENNQFKTGQVIQHNKWKWTINTSNFDVLTRIPSLSFNRQFRKYFIMLNCSVGYSYWRINFFKHK